jgi:hypothetical protein
MAIKITTGDNDYEILDSGTVISFQNEPIIFHLADNLKVIFKFITNKDIDGQHMGYNPKDISTLELVLTNFNNSLGAGNATPLEIATINGKKVYLSFVAYSLNELSSKTVHYTWYSREEVANG